MVCKLPQPTVCTDILVGWYNKEIFPPLFPDVKEGVAQSTCEDEVSDNAITLTQAQSALRLLQHPDLNGGLQRGGLSLGGVCQEPWRLATSDETVLEFMSGKHTFDTNSICCFGDVVRFVAMLSSFTHPLVFQI